ncbi:hypothetical protein HPB47_006665, partial [Ixodes persulcatus]
TTTPLYYMPLFETETEVYPEVLHYGDEDTVVQIVEGYELHLHQTTLLPPRVLVRTFKDGEPIDRVMRTTGIRKEIFCDDSNGATLMIRRNRESNQTTVVNLRYSTAAGLDIQIKLTAIVISSPDQETYFKYTGNHVNADQTLAGFTLRLATGYIPGNFDFAYLLTGMGCVHDGDPPPDYLSDSPGAQDCPWDDGFIMSYKDGGQNHYMFSQCCVAQIKHLLQRGSHNCLLEQYNRPLKMDKRLPGELLAPVDYCRLRFPEIPYVWTDANPADLMQCKIRCSYPVNPYTGLYVYRQANALDGTTCAEGKGSVLGPTLFTVYVDSITRIFSCFPLLYADDLTLLQPIHSPADYVSLQADLDICHRWTELQNLPVNAGKSHAMTFTGLCRPRQAPALSGGGFMSTDFGFSQATPQRKESNRPDNVVPCTIAQIHRMGEGEDHMTVAGLEVQYVTVVGLVTHVDQQSTKVSYTVDDRTGPPLEGHIFATEPEEQARILSQLVEGTYVRVVGSVRSVDGRRMLKTFRAFGLTDLNELTMHLAEVIHTHMALLVDSKKAPAEDRVNGGGMVKPEPMDTSTFGGGVANNSLGLEPKQNMASGCLHTLLTA